MYKFAAVTDLAAGRNVVEVPDPEAGIAELYDQIRNEGIDTNFLAYYDQGVYRVVDDRLRLEALRRLQQDNRLPRSVLDHGVPIVLLEYDKAALFRAADRVVRNQFGPAAEALYVKRLFQALENPPYNGVGGCPHTDYARRPPAQQPGKAGILRIRYQMHHETARQIVRRSEVPDPVLVACLDDTEVTRKALTAAGTAINQNPDRDPEELAWEILAECAGRSSGRSRAHIQENGCRTAEGEGQPSATRDANASGVSTGTDNSDPAAADTGRDAGEKLASAETTPSTNPRRPAKANTEDDPERHGREVGEFMNASSKNGRKRFLKAWIATLHEEAYAEVWQEVHAATYADREVARETADDGHRSGAEVTDPEVGSEDGGDPTAASRDAQVADTGRDESEDDQASVQAPATAGTRARDGAHTTSTPSRQGNGLGDHEVANPSRGQSNDGPSGGWVTHAEAEDLRQITERVRQREGSLNRAADVVGVGTGSLQRLLNGGRVSRENAWRIRSADPALVPS